MKEIEVKARIKDVTSITNKLNQLGCKFEGLITQKDIIFLKPPKTILEVARGDSVLRIRNANGKFLLTLKQQTENQLACIEKEVSVNDPQETEEILNILGFIEAIKINKVRRKCNLQDLEICVDEVENLGNFIEVEKMSGQDSLEVQAELFGFLENLGIKKEDRVVEGYDTLLYKKINNIK